jgi:hypothetical protein
MRNRALVRLHIIHKLCVIVRKKDDKSNSILLQAKNLNFVIHKASTRNRCANAQTHYYASLLQTTSEGSDSVSVETAEQRSREPLVAFRALGISRLESALQDCCK